MIHPYIKSMSPTQTGTSRADHENTVLYAHAR